MSDVLQAEALLRTLILTAPVLVLLALACTLIARKSSKPQRPLTGSSHGSPGVEALSNQESAGPMSFVESHSPPAVSADGNIVELERNIAGAEADGQHQNLAAMYLALAARKGALGLDKDAQAALRSAAGIGAQFGPDHVHAAARIALAEAAFDQGDLTMACEQWQIARNAFQRDGKTNEAGHIDKRMRANGCPTDWVLTDF